jgi:hypothetical protein
VLADGQQSIVRRVDRLASGQARSTQEQQARLASMAQELAEAGSAMELLEQQGRQQAHALQALPRQVLEAQQQAVLQAQQEFELQMGTAAYPPEPDGSSRRVPAAADRLGSAVEAPALGGSTAGDAGEGMCIICWERGAEVCLQHHDSVHLCVCQPCSQAGHSRIAVGQPCPMCQQCIEGVFLVFKP